MSQVPEGWEPLKDGMALGREPGTLVFQDGEQFGPQTIELDTTSYVRPIWRFKPVSGFSKTQKGIIPVKTAFDCLLQSLQGEPTSIKEWTELPFHPPGSHSDRSVVATFDDEAVSAKFFASVAKWFSNFTKRQKISWDEAVCPANIVPEGISCIIPRDYVKAFSKKEFPLSEANKIFNTSRLPNFPKWAVKAEHGSRQHFLSCLNTMLTAEALARQHRTDASTSSPYYLLVKATLQPVWTSFLLWAQKKLELRKIALRSCYKENNLAVKLLASNPLSEELFDPDTMQTVNDAADHQAKSLLLILGFQFDYKRKQSNQGQRNPKRHKKAGNQQAASNFSGQQQHHMQYNPHSPSRRNQSPGRQQGQQRQPSTPRGRRWRPSKHRGGRTPNTPSTPRSNQQQDPNASQTF